MYVFKNIIVFLFLTICQSEIIRIQLTNLQDQKKLLDLINLLQKSQAEILELHEYTQFTYSNENLQISTQLLQKNKHKLKHQKKILQDYEPFMNLKANNIISKHSHSLQPVNKKIQTQVDNSIQGTKLYSTSNGNNSNYKARVPLTNAMNTMFVGGLVIGTNSNNQFTMIFDTGSAILCVASEQCKDIGCQKSNRYNRHNSSTFKHIGREIKIQYGSGAISGVLNKELVQIDNLQLQDVQFVEIVKQYGDAFAEGKFDGLVGLGFTELPGVPSLFDYIMQQHKLDFNLFTFHFNRKSGSNQGSELIFGGYDSSKIVGQWNYHKLHSKHYWTVEVEEIRVGNENTKICSINKKCPFVIDTGTTLMAGPQQQVHKLLNKIEVAPRCSNFRRMPSITFIIDKQEYEMTNQDYILTITKNGIDLPFQHAPDDQIIGCVGSIMPIDLPTKMGHIWILGDIFLTKYNPLFDRDNDRIGLALSSSYK